MQYLGKIESDYDLVNKKYVDNKVFTSDNIQDFTIQQKDISPSFVACYENLFKTEDAYPSVSYDNNTGTTTIVGYDITIYLNNVVSQYIVNITDITSCIISYIDSEGKSVTKTCPYEPYNGVSTIIKLPDVIQSDTTVEYIKFYTGINIYEDICKIMFMAGDSLPDHFVSYENPEYYIKGKRLLLDGDTVIPSSGLEEDSVGLRELNSEIIDDRQAVLFSYYSDSVIAFSGEANTSYSINIPDCDTATINGMYGSVTLVVNATEDGRGLCFTVPEDTQGTVVIDFTSFIDGVDISQLMVVEGTTLPLYYKDSTIKTPYIKDELLIPVYKDIEKNNDVIFNTTANLFNPAIIQFDGADYYFGLTLTSGKRYVCNIPYSSVVQINTDIGALDNNHFGSCDGGIWFELPSGCTEFMILFSGNTDVSRIMLIEGNELPSVFIPYGYNTHIRNELLSSVYAEIDNIKNVEAEVATSEYEGGINYYWLVANKVYNLDFDKDIHFVLPKINNYSRILVQANITKPISIDWGTEYFFDAVIPAVGTGEYNFVFESNGGNWYVKTEMKGSAASMDRSVRVFVSGEYEGVNHWEDATYTFNVVNGVADDWGWLSNGEYKFRYYPETGQIKNDVEVTGDNPVFVLEEGKGVPEYIVIPTKISAFDTDYYRYEDKTIALYARTDNYGIFRWNTNANTNVVVPEGITEIPNNVFGQNAGENDVMTFILPSTLTTIKSSAFKQGSGNGALYKEIIIPNAVTSIENQAFTHCRFETITLPSSATTVNWEVFFSCRNLKTVIFNSDNVTLNYRSFPECVSLTSIIFTSKNIPTISIDGGAFEKSPTNFTVHYPAGIEGYEEALRNAFSNFPDVTFESM